MCTNPAPAVQSPLQSLTEMGPAPESHSIISPPPPEAEKYFLSLQMIFFSSEEHSAHRTTQPCVLCLSSLDQCKGFVVRFIYPGRVVGLLCFIPERSHSKNTPQFTYSFTYRCWNCSQFGLFRKPL